MNDTITKKIGQENQQPKKPYSCPQLQPLGSINQTTKDKKLAWDMDNGWPFLRSI